MNRKNSQILKIIQQNGRISNAEIARQVGLAPSAVLERLRKLEDQGVISDYTAKLDKRKLGFSIVAFIFVRSADLAGGNRTSFGGDTGSFRSSRYRWGIFIFGESVRKRFR